MDPLQIIAKYYPPHMPAWHILTGHSRMVTAKALEVIKKHPELNADTRFVAEAAMLHDIGIFLTDAPDLHCFGQYPYICHGYLGHDILVKEGFPQHALVCERHTGAGVSIDDIISQQLPIPHRNMLPVSIEEQIICYADKFFSKSGQLEKPKTIDKIRKGMQRFGNEQLSRFDTWHEMFG
jgi:uncharacterized protein